MVPEEIVSKMKPYFTTIYGNPSSLHQPGQEAKRAMGEARSVLAKKINASSQEIVFVGSGSESDNLAIKGAAYYLRETEGKNHIITTKIEHHAVENSCKALEKDGFTVTWLNVDKDGLVSPSDLKKAITSKTALVSIIYANNEIGTVQDIPALAKICKEKNVLFHSDAVQAFCKVPMDVKKQNIDLLSFSAHKIHGPKGIGALYVRDGIQLRKQIDGGSHERNRRAGTENVPYIIGFAAAATMFKESDCKKMEKLRDKLIDGVLDSIPNSHLNGSRTERLSNNANFRFDGIEGESLGMLLDADGISTSTGSACSSKSLEPSHVLLAIGLSKEQANGSIRLTLSRYTTEEEINYTIERIKKHVEKLRKISPIWNKIGKKL